MKYTNEQDVPLSLAVWLATDDYDHKNDPKAISATTLLIPTKAIVLAAQNRDKLVNNIVDIYQQLPSRMGTAIHDSIERSWNSPKLIEYMKDIGIPEKTADRVVINPTSDTAFPDMLPVYMEQRSSKEINGYTVHGKFDFVVNGELEDFKSTSVYTIIYGSNDDKYVQQGAIYRWLRPDIITKSTLRIRFIFTDWSAAQARQDKNYPQSKLITKTFQLPSIEETELFITRKLSEIDSYLTRTQDEMPACSKEDLWQKDDVWKYYKDPNKTARSTKNFTNQTDAMARLHKDGNVGMVKHVPGEVVRCRYCQVKDFCNQAQMYKQQGILTI